MYSNNNDAIISFILSLFMLLLIIQLSRKYCYISIHKNDDNYQSYKENTSITISNPLTINNTNNNIDDNIDDNIDLPSYSEVCK